MDIKEKMKEYGVDQASREAIDATVQLMEDKLKELCVQAKLLAEHAGRKKVTEEDIKLAVWIEK